MDEKIESKADHVDGKPAPVKRGSLAIGIHAIAQAIGVREATIKRLVRQKKIPYVTVGMDRIFNISAVEHAFELMASPADEHPTYECTNFNSIAYNGSGTKKRKEPEHVVESTGKGPVNETHANVDFKDVSGESPVEPEAAKAHLEANKPSPDAVISTGKAVFGDAEASRSVGEVASKPQQVGLPHPKNDDLTWF